MKSNLWSNISLIIVICVVIPVLSLSQKNEEKALWSDLINATKLWSDWFSSNYGLKFNRLVSNTNISIECRTSVEQTLTAVARLDDWAHMMFNSWGRFPPSGLLEGTSTDLGAYDQCLSIKPNQVIGEPQYCMIDLSIPLPQPQPRHHNLHHSVDVLPPELKNKSFKNENIFRKLANDGSFFYWISIRTGICVPNKCSHNDIKLLTNKFAKINGLENKSIRCEVTEKNIGLNFTQIFALIVIGFFIISGLLAAIIEHFISPKKKFIFVEIFSLHKNVEKLFSPQTSENLSCLHGIRVITIFWVIFGHTMVWVHFQMFSRSFGAKDILTSSVNQLILNVEYGVDTIFFISGLLTTYITLSITKGKLKNFKAFGFLISRILRLTPQLAIFILLNFLLPLIGSGPVWHELIDPLISKCYNNWWLNLLYVQNFVDVKNMCAHHTWYTASDMQFHFLSLIIIMAFLYNIKLGFILNIITIIIFIIISSGIIFYYDLPPAIVNTARDQYFQDYYVEEFYYKPWPHAIIFFIGVAFGLVVYRKKFFILQNRNFCLIWTTILLGFWIPLMDDTFWNSGQSYNKLISALYYPFCRLVWAICISLMIWCCLSGNGGLINKFLSWKAFVPLARLTYSVYLTHAWVVWIFYGTRRERIDLSSYSLLLIFSHNLLMSYVIGAIFTVIFELPVLNINKYLLQYFYFKPNKQNNCLNKSFFVNSYANNNLIVYKSNDNNGEQQQSVL